MAKRYVIAVVVLDAYYDAKTSDPQIAWASDDITEEDDLEEAKRIGHIIAHRASEHWNG